MQYREYLYWMERVYGPKSKEYIAILPDTLVWRSRDGFHKSLVKYYFRYTDFSYHPLVGVSQEQALAYSKWRSDRVFEYFLIEKGLVPTFTEQDSNTCFTIECYFRGDYLGIKPDTSLYYPEYSLPTLEERKQILAYSDSAQKKHEEKCWTKRCNRCVKELYTINAGISFSEKKEHIRPNEYRLNSPIYVPTVITGSLWCSYKIIDLRGNVSEWSAIDGVSFGGGWIDSKERIMANDVFETKEPNAWTGFRNVCRWKKWKEE